MPLFKVYKQEVWIQEVDVEATSKEEAIKKVMNGQGEMNDMPPDYSHDLDSELWTVEAEDE